MKIKHVNGTYWNADTGCFGPVQAATEYKSTRNMPEIIEMGDDTQCEFLYHCRDATFFYPTDDLDAEAVAKVIDYPYTQQDQDEDLERINEILNVDIP